MYLWKLSLISCCVTPSGGHWAMFLLIWLRRTTDGALSREGVYAAHSTARRWWCQGWEAGAHVRKTR